MARPTKSRALYAQCAGRGLRIFQGKTDCLLLDFVGNSGRHALVSGLDILDGKWDEETVAKAREIVEDSPDGIDAQAALEQAAAQIAAARAAEAAKRAKLKATVKSRVTEVDPFAVLGIGRGDGSEERFGVEPTERQLAALSNAGIDIAFVKTRGQASALMDKVVGRSKHGLCTFKQLKTLQRYGVSKINVGFRQASEIITAIARNGWRSLPAQQLDALMVRAPGEDDA